MIRYHLRQEYIWIFCICCLFMGWLIGRDIGSSFYNEYLGKLCVPTVRYLLLVLFMIADYQFSLRAYSYGYILRMRNIYLCEKHIFMRELLLMLALAVCLHIPVVLLHFPQDGSTWVLMIEIIVNMVVLMMLFNGVSRLAEAYFHQRLASRVGVLLGYVGLSVCTDLALNSSGRTEALFDMHSLFILPALVPMYACVAVIMLLAVVLLYLWALKVKAAYGYCMENTDSKD